jgi:DNA-binding transcriptional regulator GbsR (MarR family)
MSKSTAALVRAGGRAVDVVDFETAVVDFFVDTAEVIGLPKSVAAIYGIVFAAPAPLSFAEISERLQLSKGSESQGLKVLREIGALKEVSASVDRSERFAPDLELRALVTGFLRAKVQPHLKEGGGRLQALRAKAEKVDSLPLEHCRALRGRMDKLGAWHRKGRSVIPLITKFFG